MPKILNQFPQYILNKLPSPICANMAGNITLSAITDVLCSEFNLDKNITFKQLSHLNAIACLDRYGSNVSNSLEKVGKYVVTDFPLIQISSFIHTYIHIIDFYATSESMTKEDQLIYEYLTKLNRKHIRQNLSYKNKEFLYYKNFYYFYEDLTNE